MIEQTQSFTDRIGICHILARKRPKCLYTSQTCLNSIGWNHIIVHEFPLIVLLITFLALCDCSHSHTHSRGEMFVV
ncbi:Hypothetical predicted protein [Octopus vulgaris]|uniref:Uncharacterized protein n=1 Tax=Octopus vulgaris TaxID=6645 RepID=A0AA36C0C8_OCTVU|nr:Hypothetical predicted protein [Octopus vulgaris]